MPKEQKKRGRREVKKRKLEHEETAKEEEVKPLADALGQQDFMSGMDVDQTSSHVFRHEGVDEGVGFFGLLDEQEAEYFRKADEMLELNQFADPEERGLFIANVYREADGKELKLANSQGCSRLMEKLIQLSTTSQTKRLLQKFSGHFVHLITHRFASHCCEALFLKAAPPVTTEMDPLLPQDSEEGEIFVSMENLFLFALAELEPSIDDLLMDRFASHVLRTMFAIFAGQPLQNSTLRTGKKKENISVPSSMVDVPERNLPRREVPTSFHEATSRIVDGTTKRIDVEALRSLAIDPIASPTLQLFVEIDMSRSRKYRSKAGDSLVGKLMLPSTGEEERDAESRQSFVKSLLFDTVGSHLFETVVRTAPKKTFQELYDSYFNGKLGTLSHHETAFYVVQRVLEKASSENLKDAVDEMSTELKSLLDENKVAIIKTLLTSCKANNVDTSKIGKALSSAYQGQDKSEILLKILRLSEADLSQEDKVEITSRKKRDPAQIHGSLLAQSLLEFPGDISAIIRDSIIAQPAERLAKLAMHPSASHVIEKSLMSEVTDVPFKRKFVSLLEGHFAQLAMNSSGSHVVDACAQATLSGMNNYRLRIASELAAAEPQLRDSFFGRAVWRNWKMDIYNARRSEWVNMGKQNSSRPLNENDETTSQPSTAVGGKAKSNEATTESTGPKKSALQLAAERHAAKKALKSGDGASPPGALSGVNAGLVKRKRDVVMT